MVLAEWWILLLSLLISSRYIAQICCKGAWRHKYLLWKRVKEKRTRPIKWQYLFNCVWGSDSDDQLLHISEERK